MNTTNLAPRVQAARTVFLAAMRDIGSENPDNSTTGAWDPMLLMIAGLRQLGPSATATQLRDYILKQRSFAGISGIYDFVARADNRGVDPLSSPIVRWDKVSGGFVTVSEPGGLPLKSANRGDRTESRLGPRLRRGLRMRLRCRRVRVASARGFAAVAVHAATAAATGAIEHLHDVADDLSCFALLAFFRFVRTDREASLDQHRHPLLEIRVACFSKLFPSDAIDEVGLFALLRATVHRKP